MLFTASGASGRGLLVVRSLPNGVSRLVAGLAALIALTFVIYYPALHSQLVADDFTLVGNVDWHDAGKYFKKTFGLGRNEYRPLTAASYVLPTARCGTMIQKGTIFRICCCTELLRERSSFS